MATMRRILAALFLTVALPSQASFSTFGTGCTLQNQTPAIGNVGLPRIGQTFSITYSGSNHTYNSAQQIAQPHLVLGFQQVITVIPAGLLIYQPAGCLGYMTPTTVIPMPQHSSLPRYENGHPIAIPANANLVGVQFLAQWVTAHTQCGIAGCGLSAFITSDAAVVTIGP